MVINYQVPVLFTLMMMMMQWRYSPDRALASLSGFMIVCISTIDLFYTPGFSHQSHLVVITRDSRGEAGKHG
jgi:hypothetical protein